MFDCSSWILIGLALPPGQRDHARSLPSASGAVVQGSEEIMTTPSLPARCLAEVLGTFLLVFFGCGAVHTAVLLGAQAGLWQVAVVWSVAIIIAIYTVGSISGAHINPAVTIALAAWGRARREDVLPYIASQVLGAMLAAGILLVLFEPYLSAREAERGVVRGQPGSEVTAMCYGEYFPDPGGISTDDRLTTSSAVQARLAYERERFSHGAAFLAELVGTMILALVVFAVTDPHNRGAPPAGLAAPFIGLTVGILISVLAPLTQACFNPARDFGPRLVAFLAGWGEVALPGPRSPGFLTVYILAPIVGALLGGALYCLVLVPGRRDLAEFQQAS
jgi:glycerol uptake facilitator protein